MEELYFSYQYGYSKIPAWGQPNWKSLLAFSSSPRNVSERLYLVCLHEYTFCTQVCLTNMIHSPMLLPYGTSYPCDLLQYQPFPFPAACAFFEQTLPLTGIVHGMLKKIKYECLIMASTSVSKYLSPAGSVVSAG